MKYRKTKASKPTWIGQDGDTTVLITKDDDGVFRGWTTAAVPDNKRSDAFDTLEDAKEYFWRMS